MSYLLYLEEVCTGQSGCTALPLIQTCFIDVVARI